MTFLNPFLLVALAAASIPLLLHLLNLRKLRTVEFSSLRFLKELQKSRIRRLKLRQILLLILRTLLVVFAVLAFARPAFRGSLGLPGAHAATSAVIVIDNSFSMGVRDNQGSRYRQAQKGALDVVDLLEDNDEAWLLPMTDPASAIDREPSRNREALKASINAIPLDYRRADLGDALRSAVLILDKSDQLNKELYIITDAQRTNAQGVIDSLKIIAAGTRVYLLPIGSDDDAPENIGLDSIRILSSVFEIGKPVEVRGWVHNYGSRDAENVGVTLTLNDERLAQSAVTVPAGRSVAVNLSASPKRAGGQSGYLEIQGDALEADNRRYFAFPVLDRVRVAVAGSPESMRFLGTVVDLFGSLMVATKVSPAALGSIDLTKTSAVVIADATVADASRLASFVEGGGGLVIYGGPGMDRNAFNTGLGAALGIGIGAPVGNAASGANTTDPSKSLSFAMVEREHPIFAGVFDPANPGNLVESPSVRQALPATGGETVIRLSNGTSFMSEFRRGRGRIVYIAVPPTPAWSDFPMRGIFVPIAMRSIMYVGSRGDLYPMLTVGDNVTLTLPPRADLPPTVKLTRPDGSDEMVPLRSYPSGATFVYNRANERGVYRVSSNGETLALFAANMGSGESNLASMKLDELEGNISARMIDPRNLKRLGASGGEFASSIIESRFGLELWKYMLALAILCAFAEMLVGRAGTSTVE